MQRFAANVSPEISRAIGVIALAGNSYRMGPSNNFGTEGGAHYAKIEQSPAQVFQNGQIRCRLLRRQKSLSRTLWFRRVKNRLFSPVSRDSSESHRIPLPKEEQHVTVRELAAAFLDYSQSSINPTDYAHYRTVVLDFLDKLYGDDTPVEQFKPSCIKLVRQEMMKSRRFCRRIVNRYTHRIVSIFAWGVENDLVQETTWRALKAVKVPRNLLIATRMRRPCSDIALLT